ncbi:MAG: mechanosensitive ion channel family protein [Gemmataceae bacterium]|nr:mechanosensitive ion channel family protein [Gemmataceae bacterium]
MEVLLVASLLLALSRLVRVVLPLLVWLCLTHAGGATPPPIRQTSDVPLQQKLASPRDTLQSLYYSIDLYDFYPPIIRDAVATLDLGDTMPPDSASAALLAVELEGVLNSLHIPLAGVPDRPTVDVFTIYDSDDIKIVVRKYTDGLWRFDRATVDRIPAMRRVVLSRQKSLMAERATLREGYTDARTTLRRFWVDSLTGDYSAAARALDLSALSTAERREVGPQLAQMLAFVLQRRGYTYSQLFSDNPTAPPFTWHADTDGRIVLCRVPGGDGRDAWLFDQKTVKHLPKMYAAGQNALPDSHFTRLGLVVPPVSAEAVAAAGRKPDTVPERLGSPLQLLRSFFRAMDSAESNETKLTEALECLDLGAIPDKDRRGVGTNLAGKLEAVLRAVSVEIASVPDVWDAASPYVLGEARGLKVELVRQPDGAWKFGDATMTRVPALFEKLDSKERSDRERIGQFDSARDTTVTFLHAVNTGDLDLAASCLDLSDFFPGAAFDLGPTLAYKLKYIIDRSARIYIQEVPDDPDGPRYVLVRSDGGRIVLGKKGSEPRKGAWVFTPETVKRIEPMFREVMGKPIDAALKDIPEVNRGPRYSEAPGVWLRHRLPEWSQKPVGPLDIYQWGGLGVSLLVAAVMASFMLGQVHALVGFLLRQSGSVLSTKFVAKKLRPLTWLVGTWLIFKLLVVLDLPASTLDGVLALKKFLIAGLFAWVGFGIIDLAMGMYMNSEFLKPHRSLGDMIVPVSMKAIKGITLVLVATYVVYQVGQGDLLARFLTGLGVAGLAASLAAQDALKSFFGTLMLISERSFKIGDRIQVDGKTAGIVDTVGFRSTRLRTDEGTTITVPNATLASALINNGGNMPAKQAA